MTLIPDKPQSPSKPETRQKEPTDYLGTIGTILVKLSPWALFGVMFALLKPYVDLMAKEYGPFAVLAFTTPYLMTGIVFIIAVVIFLLMQRQIDRIAESRDRLQEIVLSRRLSTKEEDRSE